MEKERAAEERWATEERGAMKEVEWATGVPAVGEGMTVVGDHERDCGGGEAGRERGAVEERGVTEERGATKERGAAEEAAWPTGLPVAREGTATIGYRERPMEEGRVVEKERATKERGATEERGAAKWRGAVKEVEWPMGVSAGGEGMMAIGDRERPCRGEGSREREGGGGERGCGGERVHEGDRVSHGSAGNWGGDGRDRRL